MGISLLPLHLWDLVRAKVQYNHIVQYKHIPTSAADEIDSYMYQTVGQDAIEFIAQALEVPLYRRMITGTAVNIGSDYGNRKATQNTGTDGDETEDLYALLSTVKFKHPEIEGVSVGAIFSTYQRVRVEHVCRRLSLTPLCYLWQRNQEELLSEMIEAGIEAVLIKVAGMGLTTRHLGQTLAQMQPTLVKLNALYDLHICGEGGEYETLTLDCPMFRRRINFTETETVIHSDNDFATVAYLRVTKAELEEKPEPRVVDPTVPPLLEDEFAAVQDAVRASKSPKSTRITPSVHSTPLQIHGPPSIKTGPSWIAITDVQLRTHEEQALSIEDEARECFRLLQDQLAQYGSDYSHCTNINLFISSMDLLGRINVVYATFFGSNPPARACVAVDLPGPGRIKIDCLAYAEQTSRDRYALHVQGLSYWAPANIGPYSQAVVVDERAFISGQIGLEPSSLSLPSPQSLALETALACQHVSRVVNALRKHDADTWKGHTQLALYWLQNYDDIPAVRHACAVTEQHGTPTLYVVVAALPKGALVEKQVILHTGRFSVEDEEEDIETRLLAPTVDEENVIGKNGSVIHLEYSHFYGARLCAAICFRGAPDEAMLDILKEHLNALSSESILHGTALLPIFKFVASSGFPFFHYEIPYHDNSCSLYLNSHC